MSDLTKEELKTKCDAWKAQKKLEPKLEEIRNQEGKVIYRKRIIEDGDDVFQVEKFNPSGLRDDE